MRDLVLGQDVFQVVDAKSGDDITRSILLQIILEEESGGTPMFTSDLLAQMIRFYGNAMQGFHGALPGKQHYSVQRYAGQVAGADQEPLRQENSPMSKDMWTQFLNFQGPAMQSMMGTYMEQSKRMFAQMQDQINSQTRSMFTGFPFPGGDDDGKK